MHSDAQQPVAGILWMVVTGLCFVAVTALVKFMDGSIPAPEAAFLRYILGLVFLLPMVSSLRGARLSPRQWRIFGVRGIAHSLGVILWFFAMTRIPLAEVTAMNYLTPIFVTVLAVLVLRERLAARRIIAIGVALFGAMIILRPGMRELDIGHLAMLGTALFFSVSYLTAKIVSDELPPAVIVALLSIFVTLGLAPFAIAVWVPPGLWDLGLLLAVAFFATAGHYTMTLAFAAAPITLTQPVTFLQLVWAVALGAVVFGEGIDPFVILGGALILGSTTFITWREARLKRRISAGSNPSAG